MTSATSAGKTKIKKTVPASKSAPNQPSKKVAPKRRSTKREVEYAEQLQQLKSNRQPASLEAREVAAEEKRGRLMIAVTVSAAVIFIIWLFFFGRNWQNLVSQPETDDTRQEWQDLKEQMTDVFTEVKSSSAELSQKIKEQEAKSSLSDAALASLKQGLLAEATADWLTYNNIEYGFSIKYPSDWQVESETGGVVFRQGSEQVVIVLQPDIPRVPLIEDQIESIMLDTIPATLYHDASLKDGEPIDKVITDWPDSEADIYLAGYGEVFNNMVLTFKFSNTTNYE